MVSMMGNKDFKHEMIHNTQDSNQGVSSDQLNQSYMECYQVWVHGTSLVL